MIPLLLALALASEPVPSGAEPPEDTPSAPVDAPADAPVDPSAAEDAPVDDAPAVDPGPVLPPDAPEGFTPADLPKPTPKVRFDATGHTKAFTVLSIPPALETDPLLTGDDTLRPSATGALDLRLNLALDLGKYVRIEAAHAVTTQVGASSGLSAISTGVGLQAPEAVPLTWEAFTEGRTAAMVRGRTDRLLVLVRVPHVTIGIGRQPVSFGSGLFFTPLDLVNPFTPATVDTEYKPGVDAVRIDGFIGVSTKLTGVVAYAGAWDARGITAAAWGQTTVGATDLGLFYGYVQGDHVVGASVVSGVGPVGLHSDVAVTVPPDGAKPFVRGVFGLDGRATNTTTLMGELYVQSFGTTDAEAGFDRRLTDPRYARGEVWLTGLAYYGLSVSQEFVPTLRGSFGIIGSFTEASTLLTPSLSWSVADNADVVFGGFVGLGKRPDGCVCLPVAGESTGQTIGVRSEFGLYGGSVFAQVRAYF